MSPKARKITGWVLTGLLGALFMMSASMKLMGGPDAEKMASGLSLSTGGLKLIGVVEILSFVLFAVPHTGVLGTLLLSAYLGGAIATHLEHAQPAFMPMVAEAVLWIAAIIRFPELVPRLTRKEPANALA